MTRLTPCLAVSLVAHLALVLPFLGGAVESWQEPAPPVVQTVLVSLLAGRGQNPAPGVQNGSKPVSVVASSLSDQSYFSATYHRHHREERSGTAPVQGEPVPPAPVIPKPTTTRPSIAAAVPAATSPSLPAPVVQHAAMRAPRSPAQPTVAGAIGKAEVHASEGGGTAQPLDGLEPPVMIKAPDRIPLPSVLRTRGGQCSIKLQCVVHVDGTAEVSVIQSTGMVELDDAFKRAFTGLPWYPAQLGGRSVEIPVAEIIDASWSTGDEIIDWHGRRPRT